MRADIQREGDVLKVSLFDELDIKTAPELKKALEGALDDVQEVRFDLGSCAYVSSAGLRVLLGAYQILDDRDGKMVLTHVNQEFYRVLETTGFTDFIDIE